MPTNHPIRRALGAAVPSLEALESRRLLAGSGLRATYFDNADFTAPVLQRTEAIHFDWQSGAPVAGMGVDQFSVRWTGVLEPQVTGTHTFHLTADDGARLWVDGRLVIDSWHGPAGVHAGTISLVAGQRVGIKLEYREDTGNAAVRLEWSAPGLARQTVPASALYEHNPAGPPLRIIALGDSITEGEVTQATYRFWLQKKLVSAGYNVDFVGTRTGSHVRWVGTNDDPLYPWFDQDHQSRWGGHLDELHETMAEWATLQPDVALIHIGHNDIRGGETPEQLIAALGRFIDDLRTYVPNIKIALAKPVKNFSEGFVAEMDAYRALIPALAAQKNTAASPVIVVDQYEGFDPDTDTYDTTHPNAQGERKIARKFLEAIRTLVGAPQLTPPPPATPTVANLSGYVFDDVDGDGVRDPGEAGLPGRFVYLDFNNNAVRDASEPVVATNAQGRYLFRSLPVGSYRVRHHVGYQPLVGTAPTNHQHIVRLGSTTPQATWDFGVRSAQTRIAGTVFFDINRNGQRDPGENGIANRYVFLDANDNGIFEPGEKWTVTDAAGNYAFVGLPPGLYRVRPVIGPKVFLTAPVTWGYWVTLAAGQEAPGRIFGLGMA